MIDKKYYRKPTGRRDAAMLLGKGVTYTNGGFIIHYSKEHRNPYRFGDGILDSCWKDFAEWEPVIPSGHWIGKASHANAVPCYVWHGISKPERPAMEYVIGVDSDNNYKTITHRTFSNAEPMT